MMKITEIKSMLERVPFRPFTVLLENGHNINVTRESELLFPHNRPGLMIIFNVGGNMTIFEDRSVTALEESSLKP